MMKISTITVCYNSAHTIRQSLDSFYNQDWPNKEIIVIDGGSTDGTQDIVNSYTSSELSIISEPDKGMYDAMNKGLKLFKGDALGILNSDDRYNKPTTLSQIAEKLSLADMVHGNLEFVDSYQKVVRFWRAEDPPSNGFKSGWMPAHPTFYVKRKVVEAVGSFDLSYKTASDYDWMLRAIEKHDFKLERVNDVLIKMAMGGQSTKGVSSSVFHNFEALKARQKWLSSGIIDIALFAKPMRKVGQFFNFSKKMDV